MHVIYCNLLKCHVVVTHCNLSYIMLVNKVTFIKNKKIKNKNKNNLPFSPTNGNDHVKTSMKFGSQ